MFFESHAHYDDKQYDQDRDELLESIRASKVDFVVNVGADIQSTRKSIELAQRYAFVYAAAGVHPHEASKLTDEEFSLLRKLCLHDKVVAVGEIGLDFFYEHSPRDEQRFWFKKQLALADEFNLPVIIHSREACAETLETISAGNVRNGVIHCFSGSVETALEYVKMGFYIGIGGMVTFPKSKRLVEVAKKIPLERILLETDCPYLSPVPNRGKRNDSHNLFFISEKIAELKNVSMAEVAKVTMQNALECFKI